MVESNDVYYESDILRIAETTTELIYNDVEDVYDEDVEDTTQSAVNSTDSYLNRTSPIYSITPDFISKW